MILLKVVEMFKPRPQKAAIKKTPLATTSTYTDSKGQRRCTATKDLKGTQAYPEEFGTRVKQLIHSVLLERQAGEGFEVPFLAKCLDVASDDPWDDAGLDEVIHALDAIR